MAAEVGRRRGHSDVMESPSLEVFRKRVDAARWDMVEQAWGCWGDGWT